MVEGLVKLSFHGPFGLCGQHRRMLFEDPIRTEAGIYLWTFQTDAGILIEYVGETGESFEKRMKEHMIQTFGGNYRVLDPALVRRLEVKVVWNGLWRKGTRDKIGEFASRYLDLAPLIHSYLENIEVFVGVLAVDRRTRQRIEGALANHLRAEPFPASIFLPNDVRYIQRRDNELPFSLVLDCSEKIVGLPRSLVA